MQLIQSNNPTSFTKEIIIILFISLLNICLIAQQSPKNIDFVQTDGPISLDKYTAYEEIVGSNDSGYFLVSFQKRNYVIEHYTKQLSIDVSHVIPNDLTYDGNPMYFESAQLINDNLYYFWQARNSGKFSYNFLVEKANKETLLGSGKYIKLYSKNCFRRFIFNNDYYFFNRYHTISKDETKVLVAYTEFENDQDSLLAMKVILFDDQFNRLGEQKLKTLVYGDAFLQIRLKVENDGTVFLMGPLFGDKKLPESITTKDKDEQGKYTFYCLRDLCNTIEPISIKIPGKFILHAYAFSHSGDKIAVIGFFTENFAYDKSGIFYQLLDGETYDILAEEMSFWGEEFAKLHHEVEKKAITTEYASKGGLYFYKYVIRDVLIDDKNNFKVIAEQGYCDVSYSSSTTAERKYFTIVTRKQTSLPNHFSYSTSYNDVIVCNLDQNGILTWKCKIPKQQNTFDYHNSYASFTYVLNKDKLFFIHNDSPRNKELIDNKPPVSMGSDIMLVSVIAIEIDATGTMIRKAIVDTKPSDLRFKPQISKQVSDNAIIFYRKNNKASRLTLLEFN